MLVVFGGILLDPVATVCVLLALVLALYLTITIFRAVLAATGVRWRARMQRSVTLREEELPVYTVIVPLYDEANVVPPLVRYLSRMDYPADRLEILLVCETRDNSTIDAVRTAIPDSRFRLVMVPDGKPQTKPRACNVALAQARGELCVIYDAEDRPDLGQLRLAAEAFAMSEPAVICLQARLAFYNHADNWLTRSFTVDYASWFDAFLPGLVALGLAVPLGGTSNHFLVDRLKTLGGWDPYNVTEDADLGMRIYVAGARTEMLDSTTLEEACSQTTAWIRQRTRWMKGYLQTWLVHTRAASFRELPWRARFSIRAMIGGDPLIQALAAPLIALSAGALVPLLTGSSLLPTFIPVAVLTLTLGSNLLAIGTGVVALSARRQHDLARAGLITAVLTTPAYALLASVATYRAIWQLFSRPHHWEKTPHGLSGGATDPGYDDWPKR
jgi:cellulose synthase/poly-beta-1,6-N-acetylglucosamine synthase-like glycosyltransferase